MRTYDWLLCVLAIIISASAVSAQSTHVRSANSIDSLKTTVDSLLKESNIPGASIALVHKDSVIWTGGVGYRNYQQKQPVTADHLFRMGSVSKSFVAVGIMQLVEKGKLSLDDKVHELVPGIKIKNPWRETNPVRVKHLLEHTAGFDDMHFSEFLNKGDPQIPLKEALAVTPASREVRWKPGTRFSYSNPGYGVAGYIIEKVTGQRYEAYLKEQVLKPIGMDQSSFSYTDSVKQQLVSGYQDDYESIEYQHIYLRPAGMLHSSANDMAEFVRMMLNDGSVGDKTIISDSMLANMETPETSLAAKHGFKKGYGKGVKKSTIQGYSYYGHAGGVFGFSAQYMYFPKYEKGYVLMINSMGGFGDINDAITNYLLRDVPKPEPKPTADLSPEKLAEHTGYYEMRSLRNQLFTPISLLLDGFTLSVNNDTLRMADIGGTQSLLPVSQHRFRHKDEVAVSTFFMDTEEYGKVMVYDERFYVKTGTWKKYLYRGAFFGGLGILGTFILFSLFWIPFEIYRKYSSKQTSFSYQRLFLWPFGALVSLGLFMWAGTNLTLLTVGEKSIMTVLIMISSYLFALCAIGSLWVTVRGSQKDIHWSMKTYFALVSITLIGFTVFLTYWDWMGIRLWAY